MKKLIALLLSLLPYIACADALSWREQLEEDIAKDSGLESVVLLMPTRQQNLEGLELVEYKYSHIPGKVILTLKNQQGELYIAKAKLDASIMVPAPESDIDKGSVIAASQLIMVKYPKSREKKNVLASQEQIIGAVAKKNLTAKKFISTHDIMRPAVISKGNSVKMVYVNGSLSIETRGIALEQGGLGDVIKVRNSDSNKSIAAKILNENTVLVGGR